MDIEQLKLDLEIGIKAMSQAEELCEVLATELLPKGAYVTQMYYDGVNAIVKYRTVEGMKGLITLPEKAVA
jgi:hypothetical protein